MSCMVRNSFGRENFQRKPDAKQFLFWPEMWGKGLDVLATADERISTYWTTMGKMHYRLSHGIFVINGEAGNGKASSHFLDWKNETQWACPEQVVGKRWCRLSHSCQANAPWSLSFIQLLFFECLLHARHQSTHTWETLATDDNACNLQKWKISWTSLYHLIHDHGLEVLISLSEVTELVSSRTGIRTQFILPSKFIFPLLDAGFKLLTL